MNPIYPTHSLPYRGIKESNLIPESALVAIWEKVQPGTVLKDRFGNLVTIFSPGRKNRNEGPDFLDAVLWVNGEMKKGAVEIHSHESSWNTHGHWGDVRYDPVILHTVSTLARHPVLDVTTVHLDVHSLKKRQQCLLPHQALTAEQMMVLVAFGLKQWEEKVFFFKKGVREKGKRIFTESLVNFGAGENRPLYRELGTLLFPHLKKNFSKENWVKNFKHFSSQFPWHRGGTMPARHPQRIMDGIARWSFDQFVKQPEDTLLPRLKHRFKAYGFGEGTWVEWCGNVHFPAMAGSHPCDYASYFDRWSGLLLPAPYGGLNRFFGTKLTRKQLRSFPIAQGLLHLKNHYCSGWHCHVFGVKRSL